MEYQSAQALPVALVQMCESNNAGQVLASILGFSGLSSRHPLFWFGYSLGRGYSFEAQESNGRTTFNLLRVETLSLRTSFDIDLRRFSALDFAWGAKKVINDGSTPYPSSCQLVSQDIYFRCSLFLS